LPFHLRNGAQGPCRRAPNLNEEKIWPAGEHPQAFVEGKAFPALEISAEELFALQGFHLKPSVTAAAEGETGGSSFGRGKGLGFCCGLGLFGIGFLGGGWLGQYRLGLEGLLLPSLPLLPKGKASCCHAAGQGQAGEHRDHAATAEALVFNGPARVLGLRFELEILKLDEPGVQAAALA
jgi:hypothetical protein